MESESGDLGKSAFGEIGTTRRPDPARMRHVARRMWRDGIDGPDFPRRGGALMSASSGAKTEATDYVEIAENAHFPDCREFYGAPPAFRFQQEGASSRTANVTLAYLGGVIP